MNKLNLCETVMMIFLGIAAASCHSPEQKESQSNSSVGINKIEKMER